MEKWLGDSRGFHRRSIKRLDSAVLGHTQGHLMSNSSLRTLEDAVPKLKLPIPLIVRNVANHGSLCLAFILSGSQWWGRAHPQLSHDPGSNPRERAPFRVRCSFYHCASGDLGILVGSQRNEAIQVLSPPLGTDGATHKPLFIITIVPVIVVVNRERAKANP